MARAPDERYEPAKAMFLQGMKLVEIASQLNLPEGTVRRWKSTHKWESERSDKISERSEKKKRGAQPGNKNATGPPENKNAEKYGFFSKYLPEETVSIIQEMPTKPLDVLWDQIQIAYAAIIRAQSIMYVKDRDDKTIEKVGQKDGDTVIEERWEVQQAWDKQGNFLKAQARAQGELRSLIRQYDEQLHKNWELATEEQRARIEQMRAQTDKVTGNNQELEDMDGIEGDIYGIS
ncbi:phage terminase small subunit [[Clostridium] symbiosum]|uniref:phage terminase small subunit n=1 Tax=Clostridium symbiosum TaxID=1512 RepID=UPI0019222C27|nr:phage terminase small subunit [[Clostridium] symbiosum]MDB2032479.1 phage terminase small subunit [[Clostridium] symbiosum]